MIRMHRLLELIAKLERFEIVPGVQLPPPMFEPAWSAEDVESLRSIASVPGTFEELVRTYGGISAIDTAGGLAFLSVQQIRDHLNQDYGHLLRAVGDVATIPFASNGAGDYLLLAGDNSAVWKFNAHMHPVAEPKKIARSLESFLDGLADDWECMLTGRGGPYSTS